MQVKTVAIVTGASRGLGHALAMGLIQDGNHVIAIARNQNGELASRATETGASLQQLQANLSDSADVTQAAQALAGMIPQGAQRYLLINNAGTVDPVNQADDLLDPLTIAAAFTLNVTSIMVLTAAVLRATPANADRRILNISSGAGRSPTAGWGVYCATKAALDMYTQVFAAEKHGARVVSLAPGVVDTQMQEHIRGSQAGDFPAVERFVQLHEQGQLASPAIVANKILRYIDRDDFGATVLDDIRTCSTN
ncbi:MAG TPA: SDR family oxidoreductase [Candidimonas sp.]|nr:SDR family oxidoreductase [Candidimonas sp.]